MATMDHWFLELQLGKFNFDGLIIQLEQFFGQSLLFSLCPYLKLCSAKLLENLSTIKGQQQRFDKLISNNSSWPSEHGFEFSFEKSLFVFEISAFKVRN